MKKIQYTPVLSIAIFWGVMNFLSLYGDFQSFAFGDEGKVWVIKEFTGPPQCAGGSHAYPVIADTEKVLLEQNIQVFEKREVPGYVCEACGCPAYYVIHGFFIKVDDFKRVVKLGFDEAEEGQYSSLKKKQK